LIAFKEGESSTVSALNVLGRKNFTTLLNAFPTVSNFVIDLFSTIGFTSIYLIGVDLGFVDVKHHHSKSSGFYQADGKETYDFTKSANTSLIVPGNFRPTVNTKHEFKVSRQVIEQVTGAKPKGQEFYNCSDGAKIQGTLPLRPEALLIVATDVHKSQAIKKLKTRIFSSEGISRYADRFENQYLIDLLIEELRTFESLLDQDMSTKEDVQRVITKQKEMLFGSYKKGNSLLFYYLYGTVNYANAILTKLVFTKHARSEINEACNEMRKKWGLTLSHIKGILTAQKLENFDVTSFHQIRRERAILKPLYKGECVLIISDSKEYTKACKEILESLYPWFEQAIYVTCKESEEITQPVDYCIFVRQGEAKKTPIKGSVSTVVITESYDSSLRQEDRLTQLVAPRLDTLQTVCTPLSNALITIIASFNQHQCNTIVPKYQTCNSALFDEKGLALSQHNDQIYDFGLYMAIYAQTDLTSSSAVARCGSRGKPIFGELTMKHLVYKVISPDVLASIIEKHVQKLR
jgi:hypothetical protein